MFERKKMNMLTDYTLFRGDELPEVVGIFLKENKIILPDEKILFCMCGSNYDNLILLSTNERVIHYFEIDGSKKTESVYWKDIKSIDFDFFIAKIIVRVYGADTMNMEVKGSPLGTFFDKLMIEWKKRQNRGTKAEKRESPSEIIKRRYAKGEITKNQFEEMKKNLI
jgi:hypothetical protein